LLIDFDRVATLSLADRQTTNTQYNVIVLVNARAKIDERYYAV